MRLSICHTTRYRFAAPVAHALERLRLTPKETQGQQIIEWAMEYAHASEQLEYEDQHCNTVTLLAVEEGAQEVVVTCRGTVETQDNAGLIGQHSGHLPLWSFLRQTPLTRPGPQMRAMLRSLPDARDDRLAFLHDLSAFIRREVAYTTGVTDAGTSAEEAIERGAGVCQDHAHIFLGAARACSIPARYVSGYLMLDDRVEQEATHAWAEAHVEGLGWVGFDISNGISPDPRYVRVATGFDYRDAAPIVGISLGSADHSLEVEVAVQRQQVQE